MTGRLEARGIRKSFDSLAVLDGVDVLVESGQVLCLLGPSGCGKTTLLRVLAGFEPSDEGQVLLDDVAVRGPSLALGVVAQSGGLFPWLTLRDNLAFGPRHNGRSDVDAVVDELLNATGLNGFDGSLPRELSGGMRQRASIAQVLTNRPPVLLLDEPFGALDAQTRLRMHEWLRALLGQRPTTTVLVTHDVEEALLLGDQVGLLSGRPSLITKRLVVPFGAHRGRHTVSRPDFVRLKAEVLDQVLAT
ncbi:MAG: ABC transporter ATP-binding protein [Acidimicrobiales bacterium]|nr:MAG: ABC transporter ATP-binding protein [Acidimicrobiales bacterium]